MARLRFAVHTTKGLELVLAGDDVIEFGEAMERYVPKIKKRADALLAEEVFRQFLMSIDALVGDGDLPELSFPPDMPPVIREAVQQVLDTQDFATREDMMGALQEAIVRADDSPHDELFGHTTGEVITLLGDDWTEPGGAFSMNRNLSVEQLADSDFCMDALRFLKFAESTGGFKLTPKKSLNRESVRLLLDSGCFPRVDTAELLRYSKIINEADVRPLHMVHLLLREIGLVRHYKGKMVITKSGRQILDPDCAGGLQCDLFHTLFKEFYLGYLDTLPEYHGVQATIPFILYAIQKMAQEPIAVGDLVAKAYMPAVAAEFSESPYPRHALLVFFTRVLHPLEAFGLVQIVSTGDKREREISQDRVQVTPLFNAMLHFDVKG